VVQHELAALSLDGYSQATGGILVQVIEEEAEAARDLIEAKDSEHVEPPTEPGSH
jgi:hypothetical protein